MSFEKLEKEMSHPVSAFKFIHVMYEQGETIKELTQPAQTLQRGKDRETV